MRLADEIEGFDPRVELVIWVVTLSVREIIA